MLSSVAETNDQLLARWRETLATVRGYDGQQLDPVDRQTLNELRRQLEAAEQELARRGLQQPTQPRAGDWRPLALHEPAQSAPVAAPELTWEPAEEAETDWFLHRVAQTLDYPDASGPTEWLMRHRPELRGEWERERARELPFFEVPPRVVHHRPSPFVPDLHDGLTTDQRSVVERLALAPCAADAILSAAPDDRRDTLAQAIEQLQLARPWPLLENRDGLLRLTALAKEMVSVENGRARVHGGLFPNLLVNGAADQLAFPVRSLDKVYGAAIWLLATPEMPLRTLEGTAQPLLTTEWWDQGYGDPSGTHLNLVTLPRRVGDRLEFNFSHPDDAQRAAEVLGLAEARGEFEEGTRHTLSGSDLFVSLPRSTFGLAVLRRLSRDRALESSWRLDPVASDGGEVRIRTLRELFDAFLGRTRREVGRQLRRRHAIREPRLDAIEGLLRVADDERLAALVDATESKQEGIWALTHLGSPALVEHPRLGRFAVDAEPFSEVQAAAIVETKGLHRKRHFLELEHEAFVAENAGKPGWVTRAMVDEQMRAEFNRMMRLAHDGAGRR